MPEPRTESAINKDKGHHMSNRLNHEKQKHLGKKCITVKDESERFDNDRASKWLKVVESAIASKQKLKAKKKHSGPRQEIGLKNGDHRQLTCRTH